MILIMGTPKKVPLILGNPHIYIYIFIGAPYFQLETPNLRLLELSDALTEHGAEEAFKHRGLSLGFGVQGLGFRA